GLNDSLSLMNGSNYSSNVDITWTFEPIAGGFGAPSLTGGAGAPLSTISKAGGAQTPNLANWGLQPRNYKLTMTVTDKSNKLNTVSATKNQISLVLADLSQVKVYPNPWRSDRHGVLPITFTNLTGNTTIKIFTASGHQVRKLTAPGASVT